MKRSLVPAMLLVVLLSAFSTSAFAYRGYHYCRPFRPVVRVCAPYVRVCAPRPYVRVCPPPVVYAPPVVYGPRAYYAPRVAYAPRYCAPYRGYNRGYRGGYYRRY